MQPQQHDWAAAALLKGVGCQTCKRSHEETNSKSCWKQLDSYINDINVLDLQEKLMVGVHVKARGAKQWRKLKN